MKLNEGIGLSKRLGAYSVAAGTVLLGAASADAGLKVFDHRTTSFYPIVDYWTYDQTLAVMNVKTGDFQYVVDTGGGPSRYDQDGFVDNTAIPEAAKTDDTVWFSHRDVIPPGKTGAGDAVLLETPTGGAGGQTDPDGGSVFDPARIAGSNPNTWEHLDLYYGDQTFDHDDNPATPDERWGLPYPIDPGLGETLHNVAVDGSLAYNDSDPNGYTGAVTHGFGGLGHGSGSDFGVVMYDPTEIYDRAGRTLAFGFKLEEADGTHYGWVAVHHDFDRNRMRNVLGWAYQTTPGVAAELTWVGDPDGVLGDFDGDDDVDADDIDILCANMGGDVATYDMDGDLDVDEDDMIYHIENLVELQDGSGRVGTMRGDFNLDGFVNATDLAIMKPNFGLSGMLYSDGNANCDTVINGTDLAVLSANIGFAAPTGAVPEPATLSVLALGAAGIAGRRRRK